MWQAAPFVRIGDTAEPRTSQGDVCGDLGFRISGHRGLWCFLGEVAEACALGAEWLSQRGSGLRALRHQLLTGNVLPTQREVAAEKGGRTGSQTLAC